MRLALSERFRWLAPRRSPIWSHRSGLSTRPCLGLIQLNARNYSMLQQRLLSLSLGAPGGRTRQRRTRLGRTISTVAHVVSVSSHMMIGVKIQKKRLHLLTQLVGPSGGVLPRAPLTAEVTVGGKPVILRCLQIQAADDRFGAKIKLRATRAASGQVPVPNVSTWKATGSLQPIAYEVATWHSRARWASTTVLVINLAMYAPDLSTLEGSLPENAPPPCGPSPPYVSTMSLRPVRTEYSSNESCVSCSPVLAFA